MASPCVNHLRRRVTPMNPSPWFHSGSNLRTRNRLSDTGSGGYDEPYRALSLSRVLRNAIGGARISFNSQACRNPDRVCNPVKFRGVRRVAAACAGAAGSRRGRCASNEGRDSRARGSTGSVSRRCRSALTMSRRSSFGRWGRLSGPSERLCRRASRSRCIIDPRPSPETAAGYPSFRARDERMVVSAWMFSIR